MPSVTASDRRAAARLLHGAAALLALAVLSDSALEHYRGEFRNPAMLIPLAAGTLALGAGVQGVLERTPPRPRRRRRRGVVQLLAALAGLAGTGFHLFNIGKRPGGFSWLNLFYAAPFGAPAALVIGAGAGAAADRLERRCPPSPGLLAGGAALAMAGTTLEVALLHFRGAFQNRAMFLPVILPPLAALGLAAAAARPDRPPPGLPWLLRATAALGLAGVGFHVYGVQRQMGGWRNWSQNLLSGPPLPAPPSFTGIALAGLAALRVGGRRA